MKEYTRDTLITMGSFAATATLEKPGASPSTRCAGAARRMLAALKRSGPHRLAA